ncbi:hypothetical protein SUGI_1123140 [Cryptomeria japonica]|uniref:uncharacterized protein LOC131079329 isoform X2 n=1 Tax=Cryptomeria japonica TaxID=3369 RepID=UPI00241479C9|nr:uncharacterized protein LOC131079329 isoform X2 [Cryptomeria japonica]GLJ52746.1 hypothetical protein SUGI_1123140 [Cryptomeria japonica]
MFMEGNNRFASISSNCVYLYNWSLFRVGGGHPENGIARNEVPIAVEGFTTSDLLDHDKFRTSPIESRIEKCKLRTINGMNVLLMGAIDEQGTYENGFPFQVISPFLTGFPFNWNLVINECCSQASLNVSMLPTSKEKYAWQEKVENLNSCHSGTNTEDGGTVISSFLEVEEETYKVEESTSKIISRESLVRGGKRGRYGSQAIQSSKRLKCDNLSINGKPKDLIPSVELPENSNILSSGIHTVCVEKKVLTPEQMLSCIETYESFDKENHLIDSGSKLLRKKSLKVLVSEEDKYSVKRNKNTVKYDVIRSMKELRESKKQIQSGSCLVEAKLTQLLCSATKESGCQDQTNSHFDSAGDTVHQRIDKNGTEQSPAENEHLDQMKSNCTSRVQQTQKIQKPVSEFPGTGCKTGKLISSDKSQTKRYRTSKSSQASRYEICGKITDETVIELSNVTCLEDITSAGEKCKKYNLFPSDPDSGLISNEITSNEEDGKEQIEVDCLADVADFEFICMKEDISSACAENKPTSLPETHLNSDVNKSVKQVNNSSTKKRGSSKTRTRHTDQSSKLSETFVCYQTTVNDDDMVKYNEIDATRDANLHQVESEIEHGMTSKNCTEIGNTCRQGNGDGEKGSRQIPKTSIRTNMQPQTNRRQLQENIPPTPRRCVHTTLEEVSKENGKQLRRTRSSKSSDVHLRQMESNCTSGGQQTQKIQKPVSEFPGTDCKTGKLTSSDKSQTSRNRKTKSSQASRDGLYGEITDETVKELSNVTSLDEITSIGEESKNYNLFPSDSEFGLISNKITNPGEDGKGQRQIEVDCLADVDNFEFISSVSAENKPTSLPENHLNNDVNKSVKQLNNSSKKKRARPKTRKRHTDQSPKLSETFICYENTMNDGVMLKCNGTDATCGTNPRRVASEIEHGMTSKNFTEIGDTCQERNDNGEKGSMQTPETSTRINMQTQTNKKQLLNNIPPHPQRRVHTTPEEVSKAFGLKTSKSGRLLVPPLAYWCNQTIAYDMDGSIIAIHDASSQRDEDSGSLFFTPPKQKGAIQMQKKLCNAANENISRPKDLQGNHARIESFKDTLCKASD